MLPDREMTSLLLGLRVKPKDAPLFLIEATSAASMEMEPPIVESSKKPNVRSLARERRRGDKPNNYYYYKQDSLMKYSSKKDMGIQQQLSCSHA